MVRLLHEAGLEVILDVVYNHTSEEGRGGPTSSFRGLDNASYYRQDDAHGRVHRHHGLRQHSRLLEARHPAARARLAALLGERGAGRRVPLRPGRHARSRGRRRVRSASIRCCRRSSPTPRSPDVEADRRTVGRRNGRLAGRQLPGRLLGVERRLPRPDAQLLAARHRERPRDRPGQRGHRLARPPPRRLRTTSSRSSAARSRASTSSPRTTASPRPTSSPTTKKHNLGNGENNRDGSNDNKSFNHGVEGPTTDAAVLRARRRGIRNLLGTLLLSAGVPDAHRGRRVRTHAARQQQRVLPRQRAHLAELGARGLAAGAARSRRAS